MPSRPVAASYLEALIDGEGCVSVQKAKLLVRIMMCDREPLDYASECLAVLGIEATARTLPRRTSAGRIIFSLEIARREQVEALARALSLKHPRKAALLAQAPDFWVRGRACVLCGRSASDRSEAGPICRRCKMRGDGRLEKLAALGAAPKKQHAPKNCANCRRPSKPLRNGRCHACDEYLRRRGIERPPVLFA